MNASPSRFLLPVLAFGFALGNAPAVEAAHGVADLSWGTCSPVVSGIASPGAGPLSLVVSQLGNDQMHNAYQVRFQLGAMDDTVPDAWRFDADGCQGPARVTINHLPPASLAKSCPPFQGPGSLQIKFYTLFPAGQGYPTTLARGLLANTYPGVTSNPAQRTFLAEFLFDHAFSVTGPTTPGTSCGGSETPIVVKLLFDPPPGANSTSYLRQSDGIEFNFESGNTTVTVNGAVPAGGTTWGQIKNVYRR